MNDQLVLNKKSALALVALILASVSVTPFLGTACGTLQVWDPDANQWVPVDPVAIQPALAEGTLIAKTALQEAGLTPYIPFVDLATRLVALFFAFRFTRPEVSKPATTPLKV
jgi:hypothetical protein